MNSQSISVLNFNHLAGFIDGEGCFSINFRLRKKMALGIEVQPSFTIGQLKTPENYRLLSEIQKIFDGGGIRYSRRDNCYKYETRKIGHITRNIIPFIKKYPLYSSKMKDFILFEKICSLIETKSHLTTMGLKQIITLAYKMNPSGSRKITQILLLSSIRKKENLISMEIDLQRK